MRHTLRRIRSLFPAFLVTSLLAVAIATLGAGASLSAQTGPAATCNGSTSDFGTNFFGTEEFGNRLLSTSPTTRTFTLETPLPAGTYAVNAVAYDGYNGRETVEPQPNEQWFAQLLAADGTVLATTGTTADLADSVVEATWSGSLGEITLAQTATTIRLSHAAPGSPSVNSVRPVCLGTVEVVDDSLSTVTVNFEDEAARQSTIGLVCVNGQEMATGSAVVISVADVPAGSTCTVTYPQADDCTVTITPSGLDAVLDSNGVMVAIPDQGGVDVVVRIVCAVADGSSDSTDGSTDDTSDSTDGTSDSTDSNEDSSSTDVTTEVAGQVETQDAGAAVPQPGTPSFAG